MRKSGADAKMNTPPLIYVENKNKDGPYVITEARVRDVLHQDDRDLVIVVASAASPDFESLAKAAYFVGYGFDTELLRTSARHLRVIHSTTAGVEAYLPLTWLPPDAVLTNSSGVHAEKGGAYGAMAILMLNEFVPRHVADQRQRQWQRVLSTPIRGKTVVIVGFGNLGAAIGRSIRSFGVRVVGISFSGRHHPDADVVRPSRELREALKDADFLVLACPLTPETRRLIGPSELELLPRGAGIINIARGAILDYDALESALLSGQLSGAVLDVFDTEPLPETSPLWSIPNVIITPHTSCDDARGDLDRCLEIFAENIFRDRRQSSPLLNVVNEQTGY
jgi:glyoxylate/hydroxypyruvate reductase